MALIQISERSAKLTGISFGP
ncbi:hypothetical protein CCACVL1_00072 [Corchorus capsularis]|uniref:Uncharacterized protein n=1 Tax=Corchorus capsularis TaxID=210143 RepID=A0A1R3KYS9_COCAP|nr:hypothetical protein CCACVL1_00072 [Corchorus capsularis]